MALAKGHIQKMKDAQNVAVLVRTSKSKDPARSTFEALTESTLCVHVNGWPYRWAIALILEKAPNLQVILITPSDYQNMTSSIRDLCEERNVLIVQTRYPLTRKGVGHKWTEMSRDAYVAQRKFLMNLPGGQKRRFDELLALGFESAQMTARYFCLNGEPYASQKTIAEEYGLTNNIVSRRIRGVLHYLDPAFGGNPSTQRTASALRRRIARIHAHYGTMHQLSLIFTKMHQEIIDLTGRSEITLPVNLPFSEFETYRDLLKASLDGRLDMLRKSGRLTKARHVAMARYGLLDGAYHTYEEAGRDLSVTRETIRKYEIIALTELGILTEED